MSIKKLFVNKKAVVAGAAIALTLGMSGAAFAYFTNSGGSGTGSGTVGLSKAWSVVPTAFTGGPLYPGSGSETGTVTVTNQSNGNQLLSTITATIAAPTNTGSIVGDPACTTADFSLPSSNGAGWVVASDGQSATYNVAVDEAGTVPGAAGSATTNALTLVMNDLSQIQDNCQGATPNVTYTVN